MELEPGQKAPDFKAKDQNGKLVSLKDLKGSKIALFFYPEDDTPTCTEEACNLRDNFSLLKNKGITVIGVSPDDEAKHKKFEKKFDLPFTMLADADMKIINKYGLWAEKQMFGHRYMGVKRTTFLINEDGKIDHIIKQVRSKNHAAQIVQKWGL